MPFTPSASSLRLARLRRTRLAENSPFGDFGSQDTEGDDTPSVEGGSTRMTAMDVQILKKLLKSTNIENLTHQIRALADKYAGSLAAALDGASHANPQAKALLSKFAYYPRLSQLDTLRVPHLLDKELPSSLGLLITSYLVNHAAKYAKARPTPRAPGPVARQPQHTPWSEDPVDDGDMPKAVPLKSPKRTTTPHGTIHKDRMPQKDLPW